MNADNAARSAAVEFYGTPTLYKDLAEGDQFHFPPNCESAYVKLYRGWYLDILSRRRYRTGMRTAVIKLVP